MVRDAPPRGLSLTRGGPIYALERRLGLAPTDRARVARLAAALAMLAWLPAVVLALAGRAVGGAWDPVLLGTRMHTRLLVALPLLVVAEVVLERRCAGVTRHLVEERLVPEVSRAAYEALVAKLERARDSFLPDLAVVLAVYALTAASVTAVLPDRVGRWLFSAAHHIGVGPRFTPASLWYLLVGEPLLALLLFRWLHRWGLWARLLARLPGLAIRVEPAHADRAGGLAFLGSPLFAVRFVWLSVGIALAAVWLDEVSARGAMPRAFAGDLLAFLAIALALATLPYLPLTPYLIEARRAGLLAYTALVRRYVGRFDDRWLEGRGEAPDLLRESADFSGLTDIGTSFDVVREMRATIFDFDELRAQATVALLPFVPVVWFHAGSAVDLAQDLFRSLF